ncbi:hypothetical protein [Mesorhizobium dulcispinae]|uniref:hypothetical protein n=1 Tax=Mesorhizobium dulcispinae TaxID=3072316 RepID=UPI002A23E9DB|nr:hypothetical protein [Mesorhizobium sp. VK23D]MDX8517953.1 hypothetical protein [Mesorhizobium sp. VK23D]
MANDESLPHWVDVLGRGPMAVDEGTSDDELAAEMAERLQALLASHNGLEPTADGWRQLALELALKHEPAFQIETPVDRNGRSGIGGRPVGWQTFVLRSLMRAEMRKGANQKEAARKVARSTGKAAGTLNNVLSRRAQAPDSMRRAPFEWKAERAAKLAARKLSQE